MGSKARRDYVRKVIEDTFVDGIEDAIFKNKITRQEATKWYNFLAKHFELKDLKVPEPVEPPSDLKEYHRIRAQIIKNAKGPNGALFPRLPTGKVDEAKEDKAHAKLLAAIEKDGEEIAKGLKRARSLMKADRKNGSHEKGAQDHGNN